MITSVRALAERAYARRLRRTLTSVPRHVAIVTDGNRRWAKQMGYASSGDGHRHGAEHLDRVLGWCGELGIGCVTVYAASADNLRKRSAGEVDHLLRLIEDACRERLARPSSPWRVRVAGQVSLLPSSTRLALSDAVLATRDRPWTLTVAIGYDGRSEVVEAVRRGLVAAAASGESPLALADRFAPSDIDAHLDTSGLPDPDLVIRTSGEQRMSGFLLWQSAFSSLYFCDVYWPGFRKIDFLRALRAYAARRTAAG
ncbi:isoprenyl transferase [Asanoa ishikariensis]|uniref:Isoprenyl transferase n=1 Tax=Asanoa ishikariensis TaxID=137265 RepID=A0A1H3S3R1_9ACTN|nr:isoprenyl transferase [Asanoa ishikariensis]SDZ32572.1 short-chain Z-isoprenyl diphosphate synthase [Asanoa ishikariensis]